jgi:hypothetical protein
MQLTKVKKLTSERAPAVDQFERVVAADRISASAVYSRAGDALGRVDCLLIDKVSGKITYALVAIAAGCNGERRQALPWSVLTYDPLMGRYLVNLDRKVLESGPTFGPDETVDWNSEALNRRLHDYYYVPHFWI